MVIDERSTGFKDSNEFCIHLENVKRERGFETYMETVVWFSENESDADIEEIAKFLNKKIKDAIQYEAVMSNMMKDNTMPVSLF